MSEPTGAAARAAEARPIMTTRARLALRVLGDADVARVHAAALELLGAEGAAAEAAATADLERPGTAADLGAVLIRHHAGVLAGCAAVQAAAPGAPFFYVADPAAAGLPAVGPSASLFQLAAAQLAAHVALPLVAGGLRTTSHEPDWQAGQQGAFASMTTTASGAGVTGGAGLLGAATAWSPQQLVMDTEVFSWNATIAAGIDVQQETMAVDTIKQVGIGGNYLGQRHTRRHMKDVWRPRLLDRSMWDVWIASGKEDAYEKATALAGHLLAEHACVPLGAEARGVIERIAAGPGL
jgi:trimethylamine:corrinoid methyltransferase-like protein